MRKPIVDRLSLILLALIIFALGVGLVFLLKGYFSLRDAWVFFTLASLLYAVCVFYGAGTCVEGVKWSWNLLAVSILAANVILVVLTFLLLFCFGLLPLPESLLPYAIGSVLLAPVSIMTSEYCLRRLKGRGKVRRRDG
jgi:hypothetical protein